MAAPREAETFSPGADENGKKSKDGEKLGKTYCDAFRMIALEQQDCNFWHVHARLSGGYGSNQVDYSGL
jgi:hypothetical protein